MKKSLATLALVASLLGGSNAHAFGIINLMMTGNLDYVGMPRSQGEMILTAACIVFLPVCILDQDASNAQGLTASDLVANGYSQSEVQAIISGQSALLMHLQQNKLQISSQGSMSKDEVTSFVQSVPGVTPEYVKFFQEN